MNQQIKAYITIHFESHDYTATVTKVGQLHKFLSEKKEKFTLGKMDGTPALIKGFVHELNRITRLRNYQGTPATAR